MFRLGSFAAAILGASMLTAASASAMPVSGLGNASQALPAQVDTVRWVCGPSGRCWWRPGAYYAPRAYGFYGPRRYYRPYYRSHRYHRRYRR